MRRKPSKAGGQVEERMRELLRSSMDGDQQSYEAFLTMASAVVKRYLSVISKGFVDAQTLEDLQQEVVLSLHQKKHTYTWDRPLLPWVYAITRYRYIDFYRQKKRLPQVVELNEMYGVSEEEGQSLDWEELLGMLTPKQRQMFALVKIEGQSYAQAAGTLNMSVSALKVSMHRAVKSLKDKVEK